MQMVKKYFIDPESVAFKEGFENYLGKRDWPNPYSGNRDFSAYIDFKGGYAQAEMEIKMFGIDRVRSYFKLNLCLSAIGKPLNEAKEIIQQIDGKIQRHEINAVMLYLNTPIDSIQQRCGRFYIRKDNVSFC